jgi:hypothetical protein
LADVKLDNKIGFIDQTGKEIIPCRYGNRRFVLSGSEQDSVRRRVFIDGLVAVELNGKWGFIDLTGTEVIPFRYDNIYIHSVRIIDELKRN